MTQDGTSESRKSEPKLFNILFPFVLAGLLIWPSWSNWKRAVHLADVGVVEATSITREYTKEVMQASSEGLRGKVIKTEFSVFEYGPETNRLESEILQSRGYRIGDAITVVYDPKNPSDVLSAPKGTSLVSLYLGISGSGLRIAMSVFACLLILLGLFNLFYYAYRLATGDRKADR